MKIVKLLDAVTATGAGNWIPTQGQSLEVLDGLVAALITGTATVKLQGSMDESAAFDIHEFTADGAQTVTLPPFIRGNVTAYTDGAVTLTAALPGQSS